MHLFCVLRGAARHTFGVQDGLCPGSEQRKPYGTWRGLLRLPSLPCAAFARSRKHLEFRHHARREIPLRRHLLDLARFARTAGGAGVTRGKNRSFGPAGRCGGSKATPRRHCPGTRNPAAEGKRPPPGHIRLSRRASCFFATSRFGDDRCFCRCDGAASPGNAATPCCSGSKRGSEGAEGSRLPCSGAGCAGSCRSPRAGAERGC